MHSRQSCSRSLLSSDLLTIAAEALMHGCFTLCTILAYNGVVASGDFTCSRPKAISKNNSNLDWTWPRNSSCPWNQVAMKLKLREHFQDCRRTVKSCSSLLKTPSFSHTQRWCSTVIAKQTSSLPIILNKRNAFTQA